MAKKNKYLYISIILALVLIVAVSIFAYTGKSSEVHFFVSKDSGIIKTTIGGYSWLSGLFNQIFGSVQNAVTFSQTTAYVNDKVVLSDTHKINLGDLTLTPSDSSKFCQFGWVQLTINGPSGFTKPSGLFYEYPVPFSAGQTAYYSLNFYPDLPGEYSVTSEYGEKACDIATSANCQSNQACPGYWTDQSTNKVTVTKIESCANKPCTDWAPAGSVYPAYVSSQTCYTYDSNCVETSKVSFSTSCPTGQMIKDSNPISTISDTASECVNLPVVPNKTCVDDSNLCVSPQKCNPSTKTCVDSQCDTDVNITCLDNTTVITLKQCQITDGIGVLITTNKSASDCPTNGTVITPTKYYYVSNNTCLETTTKTNLTFDTKVLCEANLTINKGTECWATDEVINIQQSIFGIENETKCESKIFYNINSCDTNAKWYNTQADCEIANQSTNYTLYIIIAIASILLIVIIYLIFRIFKK